MNTTYCNWFCGYPYSAIWREKGELHFVDDDKEQPYEHGVYVWIHDYTCVGASGDRYHCHPAQLTRTKDDELSTFLLEYYLKTGRLILINQFKHISYVENGEWYELADFDGQSDEQMLRYIYSL
jgi:hypothetical protein